MSEQEPFQPNNSIDALDFILQAYRKLHGSDAHSLTSLRNHSIPIRNQYETKQNIIETKHENYYRGPNEVIVYKGIINLNEFKVECEDDWLKLRIFTKYDLELIETLIKKKNYDDNIFYRLFENTKIDEIKGCWLRGEDWSEYSYVRVRKNSIGAHRVSFNLFRGKLKEGFEVCHKCDRKGCINFNHLFQGTHSQNVHDARLKGKTFFP